MTDTSDIRDNQMVEDLLLRMLLVIHEKKGGEGSITSNLIPMNFEATNLVFLIVTFDCDTMGRMPTLLVSVWPAGRGAKEVPQKQWPTFWPKPSPTGALPFL